MDNQTRQLAPAAGPRAPGRRAAPGYATTLLVAAAATLCALAPSLAFRDLVLPNPFIFFAAVAASAWYGGLLGGLAAAALGLVAASALLMGGQSILSGDPAAAVRSVFYAFTSLVISVVSEQRRRAELRAHAQGERFHVTLASIGDGVIVADTRQRVTFVNDVAAQLTGWGRDDAVGRQLDEVFRIIGEASREPVEGPAGRALREGVAVGLANHTLLVARDGAERPIDDSAAPVRDRAGRVVGVVIVFRDVAERARAEAAQRELLGRLQRAQEQLEGVFGRIGDGFMAFDEGWRFVYVNEQGAALAGRPAADLVGREVWAAFPQAAGTRVERELRRSVAEQRAASLEVRDPASGRWLALRAFPDQAGLTLYVQDVTAQRRAARAADRVARLQAITAALSGARTPPEVAAIILGEGIAELEASGGAVAVVAPDGQSLEMIQAAGYPEDWAAGLSSIPLAASLPLSDAARLREPVLVASREEAAARYPALAGLVARTELHAWANLPLAVGDRVVGALEISFGAPRRLDGDAEFLMTLAQQCAQALDRASGYAREQAARAAAEEAVRLRDTFFSIAAHELKTPLTSLLGQAQLLQRRLMREPSAAERHLASAEVIIAQTQRLNRLIATLLDVARIEQGRLSLDRGEVDLAALARHAAEELAATLTTPHELAVDVPDGPLTLEGDALRLEQVLQNLLGNAVKYSPDGGRVALSVRREGGEAVVRVSDEGIGIPAEALPHLFERFYRAETTAASRMAGLGIGLYIVRGIVEAHGGEIVAESAVGAGSTFTVRLPLAST